MKEKAQEHEEKINKKQGVYSKGSLCIKKENNTTINAQRPFQTQ